MRRGELYRVRKPGSGKQSRVFVVVSRQVLVDSRFSTVICAPVYTRGEDLDTQVAVGPAEGLRHASWIMCDNLVSLLKSQLTDYVGALGPSGMKDLDRALAVALGLR